MTWSIAATGRFAQSAMV